MPRALRAEPPWLTVFAFVAGGGFFILIDHFIGLMRTLAGATEISAAPLAIFFGVAVDLFSDGVMVGTGSTISIGLGLLSIQRIRRTGTDDSSRARIDRSVITSIKS